MQAGAAGGAEAGGSGGMGWPSRTMVMRLMTTGVVGLSLALRSTRAMEATSEDAVGVALAEDGVLSRPAQGRGPR